MNEPEMSYSPAADQLGSERTRKEGPHDWVRGAQIGLVFAIALSLPGGVVAAFVFDADRNATGDSVAVLFLASFILLLSSPWWPAAAQRARTGAERLESTCLIWFGLTFTTHLTWELAWLLLHKQIIVSPDKPWAFLWWMYIDGGDHRYATASPLIITVETLAVLNGIVGFAALWLRRRSKAASPIATLMLMGTAVVHVYSALLYLFTEVVGGYPNVDTTSFVDLWIKFWILNGLWLVMPWVVMKWGLKTIRRQLIAAGRADGSVVLVA
jgi:hypothetical protein